MKSGIHPEYFAETKIQCTGCGTVYTIGSTIKGPVSVEICANCHPFYTGKQKLVDTAGRVDRFKKIMQAHADRPKLVKKTRVRKPKAEKETPAERLARVRARRAK